MEMQATQTHNNDSALAKQVARLELDAKLDRLRHKYPEVDEGAVLDAARRQLESGMPAHLVDFEAIWLKLKPQATQADIEAELRKKILKEFGVEDTTIVGNSSMPQQNNKTLTPEELEICKQLQITPEEYLKYK